MFVPGCSLETARTTLAGALFLGLFGAGCSELDEFKTGPGEVYQGQVIGSDAADADGGSSFIRSGFAPQTQMQLTFDPTLASQPIEGARPARPAGTIVTYRCPGGAPDCDRDVRSPGRFDGSDLELIPNLGNDVLSQYDFPGGGRLRNYIFGTRFSDPGDSGRLRDAMVFVSLMENGGVEVRVIAQGGAGADRASEPPLFGVFVLERRKP